MFKLIRVVLVRNIFAIAVAPAIPIEQPAQFKVSRPLFKQSPFAKQTIPYLVTPSFRDKSKDKRLVFFDNEFPNASTPLTWIPQSLSVKARKFVLVDKPCAISQTGPDEEDGNGLQWKPSEFLDKFKFKSELLLDNKDFKASKYFDIKVNNWKLDNLVTSILEAYDKCNQLLLSKS